METLTLLAGSLVGIVFAAFMLFKGFAVVETATAKFSGAENKPVVVRMDTTPKISVPLSAASGGEAVITRGGAEA